MGGVEPKTFQVDTLRPWRTMPLSLQVKLARHHTPTAELSRTKAA